jgi:HlyD family secretion protein
MKRILTIAFILAITTGTSVFGYHYMKPSEPQSLTDDPKIEIVQVTVDTLVDTVDTSGRIEPKAEVEMKFKTGGIAEEVLVEQGQYIAAGTVLVRLDTADLDLEVQRAEIDLAQQEAELEKLFEPQLVEKVASAQARLESARLKLAELADGPDQDEITKAAASLRLKEVVLQKAQWAYDEVAYGADIGGLPQAEALQEATLNYEAALADYNIAVREPTTAEIAEARSTLAEAEANLAELLRGPSSADIAAKQAVVAKARLTLEEKREDLKDAVLVAPTDGLVLEVNIEPGERVLTEADEPVLVIADTSAYLLTVEVDEIDIGRIGRDQSAVIALDAFVDREFKGRVADISPRPVKGDTNAIVTYEVTIALDTTGGDPSLLSGMTAYATIETQRLLKVMVIPVQAVQIDRDGSRSTVFVEKLDEHGDLMRVEVELGLRNGEVTQIVAGLDEGDQVIIRGQPDLESTPGL